MLNQNRFTDPVIEPESGIVFRRASGSNSPKARLLLLHGVGSNEANMGPVAAALADSLPEDLEILLLRGPLQVGPQGFAWYQVTFTSDGPSFDQAQAESSRQRLLRFIKALPERPTVIAGFSQGGIMSASIGVTEPESVSGFSLLSGRMLREIETQIAAPERLNTVSAFIAHGLNDNVLPVAWAKEADAWLERIGVPHQTHYYAMGHEIVTQEIEDFSRWLGKTLPLAS